MRERFRVAGATETDWQDDGSFVRVQIADPDGYRVAYGLLAEEWICSDSATVMGQIS